MYQTHHTLTKPLMISTYLCNRKLTDLQEMRNTSYLMTSMKKVGNNHHSTMPDVVGKFGLGNSNTRGTDLLRFSALNKLLCNTVFYHSKFRRVTWISPNGQTQNQIGNIIMQQQWKKALKTVAPTTLVTLVLITPLSLKRSKNTPNQREFLGDMM